MPTTDTDQLHRQKEREIAEGGRAWRPKGSQALLDLGVLLGDMMDAESEGDAREKILRAIELLATHRDSHTDALIRNQRVRGLLDDADEALAHLKGAACWCEGQEIHTHGCLAAREYERRRRG